MVKGCLRLVVFFLVKHVVFFHVSLAHLFLRYHNVGMIAHHQAHHQTQAHLTDDFELAGHAVFVVSEHLDIVVYKAHATQPQRGNHHKNDIDVIQAVEEQHR